MAGFGGGHYVIEKSIPFPKIEAHYFNKYGRVVCTFLKCIYKKKKLNSVVLVRERTIPTERPPLGEVSATFCG
jgi:hypothetical protein